MAKENINLKTTVLVAYRVILNEFYPFFKKNNCKLLYKRLYCKK